MANAIATNQLLPLTAGAVMSDGTTEPVSQADSGAQASWSEDSNGAIIKLAPGTNGLSVNAVAVAAGQATVTLTVTFSTTLNPQPTGTTAVIVIQVTAAGVFVVSVTIIPGTPTLQ